MRAYGRRLLVFDHPLAWDVRVLENARYAVTHAVLERERNEGLALEIGRPDDVLDGQAVAGRENAGAGAAQEALHPYAGQFARRRREPDVEKLVRHPLPHPRGNAGLELNGSGGMGARWAGRR